MALLPRVLEYAVGDMRPVIQVPIYKPDQRTAFDGTGLVSATFYLIKEDDTNKVNAGTAVIITANPLVLKYVWQTTDLDTAGRYRTRFKGFWGSSSTIPQEFVGPEIVVRAEGTRLSY